MLAECHTQLAEHRLIFCDIVYQVDLCYPIVHVLYLIFIYILSVGLVWLHFCAE